MNENYEHVALSISAKYKMRCQHCGHTITYAIPIDLNPGSGDGKIYEDLLNKFRKTPHEIQSCPYCGWVTLQTFVAIEKRARKGDNER